MQERKEKYARVLQSLRFFGTMSVYITTLSLTKRPPIQLVGQDGKIADKKISPIKYLNLKTQISQQKKNLNKKKHMTVGKIFSSPSKPDQAGISSYICLEVTAL